MKQCLMFKWKGHVTNPHKLNLTGENKNSPILF